jgi:hypothetical protein
MDKISILLPSRGRTHQLARSIQSLIDHADSPADLQWILAFDSDDADSRDYFVEHIAPQIQASGGRYSVLEFQPMGYANLHRYLNRLAQMARATWWVFWNDDAVMQDPGWDTEILRAGDRFCIQAFDTHNQHPYSIFPIVPRAWYDTLGHLSQHPLNDAYISQIAWMLDIMVRLPTRVLHDRYDLTGANQDATYQARDLRGLEGNINNPRDFNHESQRRLRVDDAKKLAKYLKDQGLDTSHWDEVMAGKRDPWAKMLAMDVNKQMMRINR